MVPRCRRRARGYTREDAEGIGRGFNLDRALTMVPGRARGALKTGCFRALGMARVDRMLREVHARRGDVVVLNLHGVSPVHRPYWPSLTPECFEALVSYLTRSCRIVTFAELADSRPGDGELRVVLSFDDGYRDFVEYALPILERHRVRANQNVIVRSVETGRPPWIVAVMDALAAGGPGRVRALRVPGFPHRLEGDDDRAKLTYGTLLANFLKSRPPAERAAISDDVDALLRETSPEAFTPMMSRADVLAVADEHELGCHSYSHESMSPMSEEEFADELDRSAAFFSSIERPMSIFAFPNGSHRPDQIPALMSRGIKHVLLVEERVSSAVQGVHPRITVYGDSPDELRMRSMGVRVPRLARVLGG